MVTAFTPAAQHGIPSGAILFLLGGISLKNSIKKINPGAPKNENGLTQMMKESPIVKKGDLPLGGLPRNSVGSITYHFNVTLAVGLDVKQ